jgi:hypothetical protein
MAEQSAVNHGDHKEKGAAEHKEIEGGNAQLANKLSQVNYKNLKFVIMDRPTVYNLPSYLRELKKAVTETTHCP